VIDVYAVAGGPIRYSDGAEQVARAARRSIAVVGLAAAADVTEASKPRSFFATNCYGYIL